MQATEFQIYNSLSRKKEIFKPIKAGEIGIYVCGMTVYDSCHLGHGRVMVAFDTIVRYMRFMGYKVKFVRNITDVDDKIINRARENKESTSALTSRVIDSMHTEEKMLGNISPDLEPKATEHIPEMLQIIQTLLDKDFAYIADNSDVYFKVRKFADYGKLSGKKLDELESGARVEVEELKQDALDFVLWKSAKADEPSECKWQTSWGEGRPGWHIECSAMSSKHLGKTFDIHGGGPDLVFPHHENEIAQSEAANSQKFVNYWMHAGALRVNKEKMSKSLGNFQTLATVMQKHRPEVVRFFLISSQYRSPINYSEENLIEAGKSLTRLYQALDSVTWQDLQNLQNLQEQQNNLNDLTSLKQKANGAYEQYLQDLQECENLEKEFHTAMRDDFNTPRAIASLFGLAKLAKKLKADETNNSADKNTDFAKNDFVKEILLIITKKLQTLGGLLGILQDAEFLKNSSTDAEKQISKELQTKVETLLEKRKAYKQAKDFAAADKVREELSELGIIIKDKRDGTVDWHFDS